MVSFREKTTDRPYLILVGLLLALSLAACGSDNSQTTQSTTAPTQSSDSVNWSQGAVKIFHSDNGNYQGAGGYTDSFTVPDLWRVAWFCKPGSDPTQAFFGFDVQHAGDLSSADGETPLQTDCDSNPHGFTVERVGGSVTLQILAGTGTSWDVYVQTPQ